MEMVDWVNNETLDYMLSVMEKDGCYMMIKRSIHQENITILNVYASNNKASKYIKQKLTELKTD